jgi:hypothetical protein
MSTTWNNLKFFCFSKSRLLYSTHSTDAWNHQKKKIFTNIPSCTFLWTPAPTVRNYINYSPYRILDPHGIPQGKNKYLKKLKIILKPKICSELYSYSSRNNLPVFVPIINNQWWAKLQFQSYFVTLLATF